MIRLNSAALKNKTTDKDRYRLKKYTGLFTNLKSNKLLSLMNSEVFIFQRYIMIGLLVMFQDNLFTHVFLMTTLCLLSLCNTINIRPYNAKS